ncbi:hypothetical protein B0O80DRAFT_441009 [Mortierella sp. GBAus27b]|nr:hypothetical protein BGX31_006882 [Mortierella sp. GBA43]KAI8359764.1 hypothetical protein B0O80DRAFT_441009 [Mortierella sp. GBAus27b]
MALTKRRDIAALLLSLAIACCLLASTCSAKPIPRQQHQQRAIAQQVQQVQFADESVHNSLVLLQRSMQKQQRKRQGRKQEHGKKRTQPYKRQVGGTVEPGSASSSTATETSRTATQVDKVAVIQGANKVMSSSSTKKSQRAKLISAYEAIVFSESQIPVFLSQDHQRHRQPEKAKGKRKGKRQIKGASSSSLSSSSSSPSSHLPAPPSSWVSAVGPKISGGRDVQKSPTEEAHSTKHKDGNIVPDIGEEIYTQDPDPVKGSQEAVSSSSGSSRVMNDKNSDHDTMQVQEHDQDTPIAAGRWAHWKSSTSLGHGCASWHTLLPGLVAIVLIVSYKMYARKQRAVTITSPLIPGLSTFPMDSKATGPEGTTTKLSSQVHLHSGSIPQ